MNIEEIDKWLDSEYGVSYTRLGELHDFLIEQNMKYQDKSDNLQQENKQLKDLCNKYEEEHKTTFETWLKEINILTELEEWLKSYLYMLNGITDKDVYEEQQLDDFADFMDKIQELKEKYK